MHIHYLYLLTFRYPDLLIKCFVYVLWLDACKVLVVTVAFRYNKNFGTTLSFYDRIYRKIAAYP